MGSCFVYREASLTPQPTVHLNVLLLGEFADRVVVVGASHPTVQREELEVVVGALRLCLCTCVSVCVWRKDHYLQGC